MTTTVIGLYQDPEAARRARKALTEIGLNENSIQLFDRKEADIARALSDLGIEEEDGQAFAGAVANGAAVLAADIEDNKVEQALSLLERNGAKAVDAYEEEQEQQGQQGQRNRETQTLREVEESVEIGKRRVARGGVRARTRTTEQPVEKTVQLEQETVDVNRRDAQRELSPEEARKAFEEKTVEMSETAEEAEVRKAARLIGEVEVSKSTEQRPETIKETARKTQVEIEKIEPDRKGKR